MFVMCSFLSESVGTCPPSVNRQTIWHSWTLCLGLTPKYPPNIYPRYIHVCRDTMQSAQCRSIKSGFAQGSKICSETKNLDEHWECVFPTKLKVVLSDHTCVDASETADISFSNLWQLCEERGSPSLWVCWPHFTRFWRFWTSFWFLHIQTDPHPGIS